MKLPRLYFPIAPAANQAANPFAQARFGIQSAAAKGQTHELLQLLEKFPRRAKDALYWAAGNGHQETVAALLREGTRPTTKALAAAKSNNHQSIVRMIERKYAEGLRQPHIEL
jgi:hypothetical protein